MHHSTFEYLAPTEAQKAAMQELRIAAKNYEAAINIFVPEGPDKTYLVRKLREVAMWANVSVTRNSDGTPRS
tara:strand:+ start:405 stop:620 length:216 start_codon:yes stop_codon:yes gene_type:complete